MWATTAVPELREQIPVNENERVLAERCTRASSSTVPVRRRCCRVFRRFATRCISALARSARRRSLPRSARSCRSRLRDRSCTASVPVSDRDGDVGDVRDRTRDRGDRYPRRDANGHDRVVHHWIRRGPMGRRPERRGRRRRQGIGRSIMARFHAAFSIGTVIGALSGAAMNALHVDPIWHLSVAAAVIGIAVPMQARGFLRPALATRMSTPSGTTRGRPGPNHARC